jgi:hypothetical protein
MGRLMDGYDVFDFKVHINTQHSHALCTLTHAHTIFMLDAYGSTNWELRTHTQTHTHTTTTTILTYASYYFHSFQLFLQLQPNNLPKTPISARLSIAGSSAEDCQIKKAKKQRLFVKFRKIKQRLFVKFRKIVGIDIFFLYLTLLTLL